MPDLSRTQLLVYGAVAVALLLLGARWLRSADEGAAATGVRIGAAPEPAGVTADGAASVTGGGDVVVHVAGEVRDPGVYRLPAGARVTDAVQRAGGATAGAAPAGLNLAARVADGQQVVMPADGGEPGAGAGGGDEGPISLGTATAEELDTIEGIGPVTAADIIAFRDERGGLASVEELDEVSGIGPATMEALRERLQP